jgi:uncharacterized protein (DUF2236 family)
MPIPRPIVLFPFLERPLDAALANLLHMEKDRGVDFLEPAGEEALIHHDSVSWRIFKNPLALFVGGVAAVLLELAEPRVRTAIWERSRFRSEPLLRMRRTGLAALATVYGPRRTSEEMISHVVRVHANIHGETPAGQPFSANDVDLLTWVNATATFGFFHAYSNYVSPLQDTHMDLLCREGVIAAQLYGAVNAPTSQQDMQALFLSMYDNLEPSTILFDFIKIVKSTPVLPGALRPLQGMLVRAAVDLIPLKLRDRLGLANCARLTSLQLGLVKQVGSFSDRILLQSNPAVQACVRLGLPQEYLYQLP